MKDKRDTTGEVIQGLAVTVLIINLIGVLCGAFYIYKINYVSILPLIIELIAGIFVSIVWFFVMKGFGVLVQNSTDIKWIMKNRK